MRGIKRVAVVQDLSGFGRCSLSVAMPVLAAMGHCVCPMPTAYLSAHTGFSAEGAVRLDLSAQMAGTIEHWRRLGFRPDGIYVGYLASEGQAEVVKHLIAGCPGVPVLVDPVLGDNGRTYRHVTPALQRAMAELAALADVITPNGTECALLLGEPYNPNPTPQEWGGLCRRLAALGARQAVVTGVRNGGEVGTAMVEGDTLRRTEAPAVPGHWSGAGDLFASVLFGSLLRGEALYRSAERATSFVSRALAFSHAHGVDPTEGVVFEPLLGELTERV